jgi:ABC-type nitrate/sulfonate/bicarbonate transport system substrate-binding protein
MTDPIRVIAFPGAPNLPTFAALEHGLFDRRQLEVELDLTPSSVAQAEGVAAGDYDVAFTAFDNVVAYSVDGPGGPDYVAILGATQLEVSLIAAPTISHHHDLRGKLIALDALGTGFAFILYEMLERAGVDRDDCTFDPVGSTPHRWRAVQSGTHDATLAIEPFTSLALKEGFTILDASTRIFDHYQGGVVAVPNPFLQHRRSLVERFVDGYLEGLEWVLDPANRAGATDLLKKHMDLPGAVIEPVLRSVLSPESGLTPSGRLLPEGMATVLDLRRRHGATALPDLEDIVDNTVREAVVVARGSRDLPGSQP